MASSTLTSTLPRRTYTLPMLTCTRSAVTRLGASGVLLVAMSLAAACDSTATRAEQAPPRAATPATQPAEAALGRGLIPGPPPGSPEQAPDNSNYPYGSLFHALAPDDAPGFVSIFDGKTLNGWDGDPKLWRVENGAIVGESTTDKLKDNSFLIWRGGKLANFELKVDFRLHGENSGVQIRSSELPSVGKWILKGYQADLDFANGFTGNIHDERGRDVLAPRGKIVRVLDGPTFQLVGTVGDGSDLRGVVNVDNWNRYHIIGRGPMLLQFLNGRLISGLIDEDTKGRALEGLLGLQMHVGDPFKVEFKNIRYRKL